MSELTKGTPPRFEGFATPTTESGIRSLLEKYEHFQRAGSALVRIETDWDETVSRGTWPTAREAMPEPEAKLQTLLHKDHGPLLRDGTMGYGQSRAWQRAALGILLGQEIGPLIEAIEANNGGVKKGAKELDEYRRSKGIPLIIKTASTLQFVEAAAKAGGIEPDIIIATELVVENGIITGYKPDTLTHSHNKGTAGLDQLLQIEEERPFAVGLGDGIYDRTMISPNSNTFWIRANGGQEQHGDDWDEYLRASFSPLPTRDETMQEVVYAPYDLVSIEPDLIATLGLIRQLY